MYFYNQIYICKNDLNILNYESLQSLWLFYLNDKFLYDQLLQLLSVQIYLYILNE